ncbi:hypothetical protein Ato02nite_001620 [Paractinoplanes toevensis]|uniref:Uncharacterized protein n=1 Tax=Paractinoplanes toevensis TaxID=571911 RepID=A0A919VZR3_9ACTN|nr:hypothetical protein Ato02nite_001620 [Actinoplanes toevensis]
MWAPVQRPGRDTTKPTMTRPTSIDTTAQRNHSSVREAQAPVVPSPQRTRAKTVKKNAVVRPNSPAAMAMSTRSGRSGWALAISTGRAVTRTMSSVLAPAPAKIRADGPWITVYVS